MKGLVIDMAAFVAFTTFFNSYYYYLYIYDDFNRREIIKNLEGIRFLVSILFIGMMIFWDYEQFEERVYSKLNNIEKEIKYLQCHIDEIDKDLFPNNETETEVEEEEEEIDVKTKVVTKAQEDYEEGSNDEELISDNIPTGPTRCVLRSSESTELSN